MAYTTSVAGTTITAAWANANVRDQGVTPFATTAAQASAISAPVSGMLGSITNFKQLSYYNGSAWTFVRPASFSAAGGGATTSGTTITGATSLTVPDQGCAGILIVWVNLYITKTVGSDVFFGLSQDSGTTFAQSRADLAVAGGAAHFTISGSVSMIAGTGKTITSAVQRTAGTGTATFFNDATLNRIDAIFIPTL